LLASQNYSFNALSATVAHAAGDIYVRFVSSEENVLEKVVCQVLICTSQATHKV